jgi:hypothetical protein
VLISKVSYQNKVQKTILKMLEVEVVPERSLGCDLWEFILGDYFFFFLKQLIWYIFVTFRWKVLDLNLKYSFNHFQGWQTFAKSFCEGQTKKKFAEIFLFSIMTQFVVFIYLCVSDEYECDFLLSELRFWRNAGPNRFFLFKLNIFFFISGMHFSQAVSIIQNQVGFIKGVQVLYSDTVSKPVKLKNHL